MCQSVSFLVHVLFFDVIQKYIPPLPHPLTPNDPLSRLFYAGAMEGQMPEILTMIQVKRMTPAPAVLFMSFLSLVYLGSSNISGLISYVGFATWVSHSAM